MYPTSPSEQVSHRTPAQCPAQSAAPPRVERGRRPSMSDSFGTKRVRDRLVSVFFAARTSGPARPMTLIRSAIGGFLVATALLLFAAPAYADRPFDSNFAEVVPGVGTLALDANGNVWVTDGGEFESKYSSGQGGLYEFDSYPSRTLLDAPSTSRSVGFLDEAIQVAVDQSNGELFVANENPRKVDIYEEKEEEPGKKNHLNSIYHEYTHSWSSLDGFVSDEGGPIHVAVDNSHTYSRGRIYLSLEYPEHDVQMVDSEQRPVDFPATASYIDENKLTGTPSGPFGSLGAVTVAFNGDLFVEDGAKGVVDEFDPSWDLFARLPTRERRRRSDQWQHPGWQRRIRLLGNFHRKPSHLITLGGQLVWLSLCWRRNLQT